MIARDSYLSQILCSLGKELIIVLTGQRRVGKSCILRLFRDEMLKDEKANVIYIDKEKSEFDHIQTYQELNAHIEHLYSKDKTNYILIDEVQEIDSFEKTVRHYHTEPNAEIVITGSNARILSSDLSTIIGGRYKEIVIKSLGYSEYLLFHDLPDTDDSLARYIQIGGMPGLAKMSADTIESRQYLKDIYHTVLLKDVILRNKIRNIVFLEDLVRFLADNTGKLISANSISKYMKSQGENINSTTIIDYLRMLTESFVIHRVNRFDIHGRRLFENNDKIYFEDHGIRNALAHGTREGDIEKVIENIVYQELIRRGYAVTVGQLQAGEIDFVCEKKDGSRMYIQASYIIADNATRDREFGNLHAIKDNYPKYVISMTPLVTRNDDNGVTHLNLRKFLTEEL